MRDTESANATEQALATARPFPWFCPRCRKQKVWRETISYECQRDFEGEPITVSIGNLAVPKCRDCGELVFDYLAQQQIERAYSAQTRADDGLDRAPSAFPASERQQQGKVT